MTNKSFILETEHLLLRPIQIQDIEIFAPIFADPEVMRYIGTGAHDYATTRERITQWIHNYEKNGYGLLAVIAKSNNSLIGFCGFFNQVVDGESFVELGYRFDKNYWNQGFATEAAIAVRDYGFQQKHFSVLISVIHVENKASMRVAEKVGLRFWKNTNFQNIPVKIYRLQNPVKKSPTISTNSKLL